MNIVFSLLLVLALSTSFAYAGPIFPTRGFLLHPKWSAKTDTTSVLDHSGFWAAIYHGFDSDSDRWGWSIQVGGIVEFARWGGDRSLFAFSSMELLADTKNDISFNPHGGMWEEGLLYAVHENEQFDWQLGTIYRCRHDIDNADPEQYSGVGTQRTLIYCSLSGKAIVHSESLLGLTAPVDAWLRADAYLIREDYRLPYSDNGVGTDFTKLAWTLGPGFQSKLYQWGASSIYVNASVNFSAFGSQAGFLNRFTSAPTIVTDGHVEAGYEFHGRAGRVQFYAGFERWQDDGQAVVPRDTKFALLGFRISSVDMIRF